MSFQIGLLVKTFPTDSTRESIVSHVNGLYVSAEVVSPRSGVDTHEHSPANDTRHSCNIRDMKHLYIHKTSKYSFISNTHELDSYSGWSLRWWSIRVTFWPKRLPHILHSNCRYPRWTVLTCRSTFLIHWNFLPHRGQPEKKGKTKCNAWQTYTHRHAAVSVITSYIFR